MGEACVSEKEEKKGNLEEFRVKERGDRCPHQRCEPEHMEGKGW